MLTTVADLVQLFTTLGGRQLERNGEKCHWRRSNASSSRPALFASRLLGLWRGRGREVIVVESQECIGSGISSRNSEVIHAGICYPTGLDKNSLVRQGQSNAL